MGIAEFSTRSRSILNLWGSFKTRQPTPTPKTKTKNNNNNKNTHTQQLHNPLPSKGEPSLSINTTGSNPSDVNPAIWVNIKRRSFTARVNATSNFRRTTWRCKLTTHFGADSVALGTGFLLYSPRVFCPRLYLAADNAAIMIITTKTSTRKLKHKNESYVAGVAFGTVPFSPVSRKICPFQYLSGSPEISVPSSTSPETIWR